MDAASDASHLLPDLYAAAPKTEGLLPGDLSAHFDASGDSKFDQ